jgi:hypothetical protein
MKHFLYLISILLMTICSCKKTDKIENSGLNGKWQLVEIYDGYTNGGSFSWKYVSNDNSHILTFTVNGQYIRKENLNGNFRECLGTFQVQPNNIVEVNSNCNTVTENLIISEQTSTTLIIDRQGIEGKIRYKYSPTK